MSLCKGVIAFARDGKELNMERISLQEVCELKSDEERVGRVAGLVAEHGLDAEIIWHRERPILSLRDAVEVLGLSPGNVLKCLLLKSRKGEVVAVMAPGDVRLDMKKLERIAGVKKLSFMSSSELESMLGVEPGGVDPLTLHELADMVFMDRTLLEKDYVIGSAGSKYCGLKVKPRDIIEAARATVLDIGKPESARK